MNDSHYCVFIFPFSCNRLQNPLHLDSSLPRELDKSLRFLIETRNILNVLAIWKICLRSSLSHTRLLLHYNHYVLAVYMLYTRYNVRVMQRFPGIPLIYLLRKIPFVRWNTETIVAMCRFMVFYCMPLADQLEAIVNQL